MKTFLKQMALALICIIAATNVYGQSAADAEITQNWRKQKEKVVNDVVLRRLQQKPQFTYDLLSLSEPDYVVYVPRVEPWIIGDTFGDHLQVFDPEGYVVDNR